MQRRYIQPIKSYLIGIAVKRRFWVNPQILTEEHQIHPVKALAVDPLNDKKQVFTRSFYACFFSDLSFNGLWQRFLTVLAATGQNIPFLFAVTQFYGK